MLTVELRVNGVLISHTEIVRRTFPAAILKGDKYEYSYRSVRMPADPDEEPEIKTGKVTHAYEAGAEELVYKVLERVK